MKTHFKTLSLFFSLTIGSMAFGTTTPYFAKGMFGEHYSRHVQMVYQNQMTFITVSATKDDDPYIWAYNHEFKKWEGPVKVDDNNLPPSDQHGNPSMAIDKQGYLHVWYGGHSVISPRGSHNYARSEKPYDIRTWIYPAFSNHLTYPTPFVHDDGSVFCFLRAGTHTMPGNDPWELRRSTNNGLDWLPSREIIAKMPNGEAGGIADIYVWVVPVPGENRLAFAARDQYNERDTAQRPPTVDMIWYFEYDLKEDCFYTAGGKRIQSPKGLSYQALMDHFLIADYFELGNPKKRLETFPAILRKKDGTRDVFVLVPGGSMDAAQKSRLWKWGKTENRWTFSDYPISLGNWIYGKNGRFIAKTKNGEFESDEEGRNFQPTQFPTVPGTDPGTFYFFHFNPRFEWHPDATQFFVSSGFSKGVAYDENRDRGLYLYGASGILPKSSLLPPTLLEVSRQNSAVKIDWKDNDEPSVTGYTVYRSTTAGYGYKRIAENVKKSGYVDTKVSQGVTYYYSVTSKDDSGESAFSEERSITGGR